MTVALRVIIADDEPLARQALRRVVGADPGVTIVAEADDLPSLRAVLQAHRVDVLFLDITMPGGSGLDAIADVPAGTSIVFTTAHAEHAVTAFELDAVDYLLKPFGQDRVRDALARVRRVRASVPATDAADATPLQVLLLRTGTRLQPVAVPAIWRLEGCDDFVRVVTAERAVLYGATLAALTARLDPALFVRVHRSHVVNLSWVTRLVPGDDRRLIAEFPDGSRVGCSRTGSTLLRQRTRIAER
ncbi:MAG: LytTR family DNA-binding domain-containing protein [Gemmatimonadota bacterium]